MKKYLLITGISFSVALALVVGLRMSPDAMAVIIGIICGVLASIPTSLILLWVLRQRERQLETQAGHMRSGYYPPVVVVNGQGQNGYGSSYTPASLSAGSSNGQRDFKVVGQENTETIGDILPPFWDQG